MKSIKGFFSFIVIALILIIMSLFYFDSKNNTLQNHENEIYNYINELGKLDALLDRQVLEIHSWYFRNYDGVNRAYKEYSDLLSSPPQIHSELELMIPKFKQQLDYKFSLIEQFKSNNSVLRNSLNYLPEIAEKLITEISLAEKQNKLTSDQVSIYKQYVIQTIFQRITNQFIDYEFEPLKTNLNIQQIPKNIAPLWVNMNIHLNIVIDFKHRNLIVSDQLDSLLSRESLVELNNNFAEHLKRSGEAHQQQKIWLLSSGISVFSLVFLLSLVVRYYRNKQDLQENEIQTDLLTGLANRRSLESTLRFNGREISKSKSKFGLVFLDLDGFKQVNDTFGHQEGDVLLQRVANNLLSCVRKTDTVFRLGGDEFVVVLPNIDPQVLIKISHNLLESCALSVNVDGMSVSVTGSVGISVFPDDTNDVKELTSFADKAMYQAKRDGKACVRFYADIT